MEALGLIELYGYVPAVEALDAALKAAKVRLESVTKVKGGLVSVFVTGDVGAVKAAMDAASAAAERVGKVVSVHVIPRPAKDIQAILAAPKNNEKSPPESVRKRGKESASAELADISSGEKTEAGKTTEQVLTEKPVSKPAANPASQKPNSKALTKEDLEDMTVVNLRTAARNLGITTMTKREIRDAKREELIKAITDFQKQEV